MYIGISSLKRENEKRDRGERFLVLVNFYEPHEINEVETNSPRNERYATVDEAKRDKGDEWSGHLKEVDYFIITRQGSTY